MGYRIDYGTETTMKKNKYSGNHKAAGVIGVLVVSILLMLVSVPSVRTAMRDFILPGDGRVTAAALQELTENLEDGRSLSEALTVFCTEIINSAQ